MNLAFAFSVDETVQHFIEVAKYVPIRFHVILRCVQGSGSTDGGSSVGSEDYAREL